MKVVINNCWGTFSLSKEAKEYCNVDLQESRLNKSLRTNEKLIEFIEKYGSERASDIYSSLVIKEIPDNVYFEIVNYDGIEYIMYSDTPITILYNPTITILN